MFRKYDRNSNLEIYNPYGRLDGHIFIYGRVGAAKSCIMFNLAQGFKDNFDYKIFDIFGGERNEGLFWVFPSIDSDFWNRFQLLGNLNEDGPKQYKVNLLYPYFKNKFPKKLPVKSPDVQSKVFTIPLKDVEIEDIKCFLNNVPDNAKYQWDKIKELAKKNDCSGCLLQISKKINMLNTALYKNFIISAVKERIFSDKYGDYNLDIKGEMEDKEAISVLCLDFVPEKFKLFVISYVLRKIKEFIDKSSVRYKSNILLLREVSAIFKAVDETIIEDRVKQMKALLTDHLRYGRRGMYFIFDTQSPAETKGCVMGSEDLLVMCKMTSFRDKNEICDELKREKRMSPYQIADLANLNKGEAYIAETGFNVKKIKFSFPRTMYWKKEYPNFYKVLWERFNGEWKNVEKVKEDIDIKFEKTAERYKESQKIKKEEEKVDNLEIVEIKQPVAPISSQTMSIDEIMNMFYR